MTNTIKSYTHVALVLDASGEGLASGGAMLSKLCCCDVRSVARRRRSAKRGKIGGAA